MAPISGRLVSQRFMAKNDLAELDLVGDRAATMIGETRIVVADDPRPVER